jgi:hypothetical protein
MLPSNHHQLLGTRLQFVEPHEVSAFFCPVSPVMRAPRAGDDSSGSLIAC